MLYISAWIKLVRLPAISAGWSFCATAWYDLLIYRTQNQVKLKVTDLDVLAT